MNPNTNQRRWIVSSNSLTSNTLSFTNPWVVLWWSMAFPGFGHILTNHYLWGFILIIFEFIVNNLGQINAAIFYSFIGDVEHAKEILNVEWALLYIFVYVFTISDSYRRCVETNKVYQLAYTQGNTNSPFHFSPMDINILEKRNPYYTCFWSSIMPGLGSFMSHKMLLFIFALIWWVILIINSNIYESIFYSIIGDISKSKEVLNPQWALFIPSVYAFEMYGSYNEAIVNNKMFEMEKSRFLKQHFQEGDLNSIYEYNRKEKN